MRANDEICRLIVENVREGIWTADAEGRTLFCNERMAEMLGTTVEEMVGKSVFQYVFPEDLSFATAEFALKMTGDHKSIELRLRRQDGLGVWAMIAGAPMYDEAGAVVGV